jgi:hypothetical protein
MRPGTTTAPRPPRAIEQQERVDAEIDAGGVLEQRREADRADEDPEDGWNEPIARLQKEQCQRRTHHGDCSVGLDRDAVIGPVGEARDVGVPSGERDRAASQCVEREQQLRAMRLAIRSAHLSH